MTLEWVLALLFQTWPAPGSSTSTDSELAFFPGDDKTISLLKAFAVWLVCQADRNTDGARQPRAPRRHSNSIVEYAQEGRRGFTGSWQQVSVGSGFLLGSLSAALLSSALSPEAF